MVDKYCILERLRTLRINAAKRWEIEEKDCHIGHLVLQALLQDPDMIHQIDGVTDTKETNLSVAARVIRLASAMQAYGLKPGDTVVIMGVNHLDLCIPYFACVVGGYSMCAIDPTGAADVNKLWTYIHPKIIFCQKSCEESIKEGRKINDDKCEIVIFNDEEANIESFINKQGDTEADYSPPVFDQATTTAWLILTSGTTGLPKVAIIPFETLLNGVICWWLPTPEKIEMGLTMASLQWMSALFYFISGPLKGYTRLQSSEPPTPQRLISMINKYKPTITAWTPYLLGRFLVTAENVCDLSCFKYIAIGGSAIEKPLFDRFRKQCQAKIQLVYGMTELIVPVFDYDEKTPYGASGKPFHDRYEYKLVDIDDQTLDKPNQAGELWIKGNDFFKGYKNNPTETKKILTDDGWLKTGDIFYKDDRDYYFYVERKKLLMKHRGCKLSPLQMEEVLKQHPSVAEACVVSVPVLEYQELPVVVIQRKNGDKVLFEELFDLINNNIAVGRVLSVAFFFIDSIPITPSGKLHRAKVKEIALTAPYKIFDRII